jgi:hypothetical protein
MKFGVFGWVIRMFGRKLNQQDDWQYCIVRSFVICTVLVQCNRIGQDGWSILYVCMGRCEVPSVLDRKPQMMRPLARTRCRRVRINPLSPELNPICYLLSLLAHDFLHVSRIRVKSLTLTWLMSCIYGAPILDVSRSHTTTQNSW